MGGGSVWVVAVHGWWQCICSARCERPLTSVCCNRRDECAAKQELKLSQLHRDQQQVIMESDRERDQAYKENQMMKDANWRVCIHCARPCTPRLPASTDASHLTCFAPHSSAWMNNCFAPHLSAPRLSASKTC